MRPRALALILTAAVLIGPAAVAQEVDTGPSSAATLRSAGYGDVAVRGMHGAAEVFVPLPAGVVASGATASLELAGSPLLVEPSTVTVRAGGTDLASAAVHGRRLTRVDVQVPADLIGTTGLLLSVRGYLRVTDDPCEPADNPAQWVTVLPSSTVTFTTTPAAVAVADLPDLLGDADDVTVAVGPDAAKAAATAAFHIGRWRADRGDDARLDVGGAPNPAAVHVDVHTHRADDRNVAQVVPVIEVADDGRLVTLAGPDGAGVAAAAAELGRPGDLAAHTRPVAALSDEDLPDPPRRTRPWVGERTSFAQLGTDDRTVVGAGRSTVQVVTERPSGWVPTGDVGVALDVTGSANLASTSTVSVTVNGVPAGSHPVPVGGPVQRLEFVVAGGLVDVDVDGRPIRDLDIAATFDLDVVDTCGSSPGDAVTATVASTSTVTFPHRSATRMDLARFPHPLDGAGRPVQIVVADADVDAGVQVAAAFGRWAAPGTPAPDLVVDRDPVRPGPLLVVGDDAIAAVAGTDLDLVAAVDVNDDAAAHVRLVDLAGYGPSVLVGGDVDVAAELLATGDGIRQLSGTATAITRDGRVYGNGDLIRQPADELAPDDRPWVARTKDTAAVPVIVGSLALMAALGLAAAIRWRRR